MSISANYTNPVYVNGYACWNCAQVADAKKDINPADPQAGPGAIDAGSAAASGQGAGQAGGYGPAVTFGGALASGSGASNALRVAGATAPPAGFRAPGGVLNLSV